MDCKRRQTFGGHGKNLGYAMSALGSSGGLALEDEYVRRITGWKWGCVTWEDSVVVWVRDVGSPPMSRGLIL